VEVLFRTLTKSDYEKAYYSEPKGEKKIHCVRFFEFGFCAEGVCELIGRPDRHWVPTVVLVLVLEFVIVQIMTVASGKRGEQTPCHISDK
jgi:hypothetical protein